MNCQHECHFDAKGEFKTNPDHYWCLACNEEHLNDPRHGFYKPTNTIRDILSEKE